MSVEASSTAFHETSRPPSADWAVTDAGACGPAPPRPSASDATPVTRTPPWKTVAHNRERTRAFVERYGDRLMRSIDREVAYEWLADGNRWTIPALRAMFKDCPELVSDAVADLIAESLEKPRPPTSMPSLPRKATS